MKQFHYFVSYQYNDSKDVGFGQINLLLKQQMKEPEQINEVRKYIESRFKYEGVVIINFILLKTEEIQTV